ncbi:MAG: TIGR01212 family radical SAM protein [Thermoguttaceae bacterium]|nr:TIGR01212 family radical SAM protein [Thermoguttaceae bacterium]MDW8037402.1 TIGR01212 family radical SAM protein [Thermoguttaceae bacterium]
MNSLVPKQFEAYPWQQEGLRYYALRLFLQQKFGGPVRKITLDAGFSCPNVDGTLGWDGCIFCNLASFSPARRQSSRPIREQIQQAAEKLRQRYGTCQFLAYFQPGTNTYGPVEKLRQLYQEALQEPGIVGLCIGTRPDCVPDEVLDLLAELAQKSWVLLELGLQTIHNRTLHWIGRHHTYEAFLDAVDRAQKRRLSIGAHVIVGLPGESAEDVQATAQEIARLGLHSVKIHNLYVARQTRLAQSYQEGQVRLPSLEEYVGLVVDFLERLPPDCVIDRLCADCPPEYLVAPNWSARKATVVAAIEAELQRRDTYQGRLFGNLSPPASLPTLPETTF